MNDATIENVDQLYDQLVALKDYLTHLGQERFDIIKECEKVMYKINKKLDIQMFMQLHPDPYFTPISIITIVSELKVHSICLMEIDYRILKEEMRSNQNPCTRSMKCPFVI